jgi:UDP-N-acetyl-D-mannosaminuronate dehydrogenase
VGAADAVVLLTDHDCFDIGLLTTCATTVLDCRRTVPARAHVQYL